jgi:prophage tail gpP-like protein
MITDVLIEINGVAYDGFIDLAVSREFTRVANQFVFTIAPNPNFPVLVNNTCKITINGQTIINGYVEIKSTMYNSTTHTITIEGRDKTCDLVDSSAGPNISFNPGLTLPEIIENCLKQLGITDIKIFSNVTVTPFDRSTEIGADIGVTMFDFLEKLCRVKQVIMTTDGNGNILLDRASKTPISTYLLNEEGSELNNILNASARYDYSKLFNTYNGICSSNPNGALSVVQTPEEMSNNPIKPAVNKDIRKSRQYYFIPEAIATVEDVNLRVQWKRDTDKAQALVYACTIDGIIAREDGILWAPNLLVNVVDIFAGVNGQFLITSVVHHISRDGGATTDLVMVSQDAFRLESEQNARDASENILGLGYVVDDKTT